jgi:hypothetical protein
MFQSNGNSKAGTLTGALLFGLPVTFVLRTFGAAGALWAASEVVGLRKTDDTPTQYTAIGISALSFLLFVSQFFTETSGNGHESNFKSAFLHATQSPHQAIKDEFFPPQAPLLGNASIGRIGMFSSLLQVIGTLVGIALTVDLEGFGSGGAFWGTTDALWLRGNVTHLNDTDTPLVPNNSEAWSQAAYGFFFFGFLRLVVKFLSPLAKIIADDPILQTLMKPKFPNMTGQPLSYQALAILMVVVAFVLNLDLDVLGVGASLWGGSYVFELRDESNETPWRAATLAFYSIALTRYLAGFAFQSSHNEARQASHHPVSMFVQAATDPVSSIVDIKNSCHRNKHRSDNTNFSRITAAAQAGSEKHDNKQTLGYGT